MTYALDVRDRQVLLLAPGPAASETIHALVDAGASVTVCAPDPDARLVDLATRGIATVVPAADPDLFEVVLRDPSTPRTQPDPPATNETDAAEETGPGRVVLVGGGPGAPGLITVAGLEAIRTADVLVCDRLAPLGLLDQRRAEAEVVHVGKIPRGQSTPQQAINEVLVDRARRGERVVRLKGGDSFMFGRGGEEWNACIAAGVPVEVVPGVTSAVAVPELAGIPVTHRDLSQGVVVVSGHVAPDDPRSTVDWALLARSGLTVVVLMGVAALPEIARTMIAAGLAPSTPAASIADGGLPSMRVAVADLATIGEVAAEQRISAPAVTVIGAVVAALDQPGSAPSGSARTGG